MSATHRGNMLNEITFEEHDPVNNAKRVNLVAGDISVNSTATVTLYSTPTLFAVVNTAAAGQASVVLDASKNFIGLATVNIGSSNATLFAVVNTAAAGQASVVLDNSIANIGFATVFQASSDRTIIGNLTLSDPKGFIGLVTIRGALSNPFSYIGLTTTTLGVGNQFIGLATVVQGSGAGATTSLPWVSAGSYQEVAFTTTTVQAVGATDVGLYRSVSVHIVTQGTSSTVAFQGSNDNTNWVAVALAQPSNTLSSPSTSTTATGIFSGALAYRYFRLNVTGISAGTTAGVIEFSANPGMAVTTIAGQIAINGTQAVNPTQIASVAINTGLGIATTGTQRMALSTDSAVLNGGTNKTLIPLNISFAQASIATVAVPTNTFNITNIILNSNATVGIRIKSGATYLIGNVSISTMLNPGGGFVAPGSPDSPSFKGLANAAAIVLEKEDLGQVAEIAGHLIYFDA